MLINRSNILIKASIAYKIIELAVIFHQQFFMSLVHPSWQCRLLKIFEHHFEKFASCSFVSNSHPCLAPHFTQGLHKIFVVINRIFQHLNSSIGYLYRLHYAYVESLLFKRFVVYFILTS